MKQPIILISTGYQLAPSGLRRRVLYQNYADAIRAAGGYPILPLDGGEHAAESAALCGGLLLTGGSDLDPALYGQEKEAQCGVIDPARDTEEWQLLRAFLDAGKPVLGICRGIQVINVFFGGTLCQDLPARYGVNHDEVVHPLLCERNSLLEELFGRETVCNSYHHQAVERVAEGFCVTARSGGAQQGIEGIEHRSLPIWGVQFHPEKMTGAERRPEQGPDTAALFGRFVGRCASMRLE